MKNQSKSLFRISLLLGIFVVGFLIWFSRKDLGLQEKENQAIPQHPEEAKDRKSSPRVVPSSSPEAEPQGSQSNASVNNGHREQMPPEGSKDALQKNVPIAFWGRVIDQDGQPIPDVRVVISVRHWSFTTRSNVDAVFLKREIKTDVDGKFELTEINGDALDLELVEKEGYRLSDKLQRGYAYGQAPVPFHPDPQNPVVIRMWRLGPSENLVSIRTLFGFQPDGRPYTLDLLANKKTEGENTEGDLIIKFERPPHVGPRDIYPWKLEISAIGGGLKETSDELTFAAPETGYQSQVTIERNLSDTNQMPLLEREFYISSRGGKAYGILHMRIRPDYNNQSAIFVESRMNPNGSRNLQP